MKKVYVAPTMVCEEFAANEYVAACGDQNKVYKFKCDAPGGILYYYPNGDGEVDGVYNGTGDASQLGFYNPCPASHEASEKDVFYDGYIINRSLFGETTTRNVIVWRGPNNNDGHATAQLDMDAWETAKS
ncbi:MAG: hypothetical protein U0L05_09175 [Schaedlerella sp.]|nr:hypothetical protein [Schaedlerella sp.]